MSKIDRLSISDDNGFSRERLEDIYKDMETMECFKVPYFRATIYTSPYAPGDMGCGLPWTDFRTVKDFKNYLEQFQEHQIIKMFFLLD